MRYQQGQEVILINDYRDQVAGTKLIYVTDVIDSGHITPLCLIMDEHTKKAISDFGLYSVEQLLERNKKDYEKNRLPYMLVETYCSTIKPYSCDIVSKEEIEKREQELEQELALVRKHKAWLQETDPK